MLKPFALRIVLIGITSDCASLIIEAAFSLMEDQVASLQEEENFDFARLAIPAQLKVLVGVVKI